MFRQSSMSEINIVVIRQLNGNATTIYSPNSKFYNHLYYISLSLRVPQEHETNTKTLHAHTSVGVEHLIALLTPQCFQIPLTPRMFPVWDFVVGIFARKALLNMGRVLLTPNC